MPYIKGQYMTLIKGLIKDNIFIEEQYMTVL